MSILIAVLLGLWMLVALLMMLVILMQRPKSEGLGAAFGGGVTENLFGAQTTNVLVKFTAWLAGIFFIVTFALSVLYAHRSMGGSSLSRELKKTAAPSGQAAPVAVSPSPNSGASVVPTGSSAPGSSANPNSPANAGQVQPAASKPAVGASSQPTAAVTPKP
jgi:preprotein translocase subunit SecG